MFLSRNLILLSVLGNQPACSSGATPTKDNGINFMYKLLLTITFFVLALPSFSNGAPGDLDPTFGNGGIATAQIGKFSGDTAVGAVQQADGKILIVGASNSDSEFFAAESGTSYLARINADGSLDKSFGGHGSGFTPIVGAVSSVAIRPDGKIVVAGADIVVTTESFLAFAISRFNQDGSYDQSFGTEGIVTTPFDDLFGNSRASSVTFQLDGKVVAAGYATNGGAMLAARYNEDGSLDTGFSTDGRAAIMISNGGNRANAVIVQTDGKILMGGSTRAGTTGTMTDFALVRLNTDGTLDGSFDDDGKVTTRFEDTSSTILGIDIHSDGTIVATGNSVSGSIRNFAVARYNGDGSPDVSFDQDGKVITDINLQDSVFGVQTQEDGKIVICGHTLVDPFPFVSMVTVRYNVDGSLDNSYDGDGIAVTAVPDIHSSARAVLIQPDARIMAVGYTGFGGFIGVNTDILLARYQVNGQPDESFGADGVAVIEFGNASDMIFEMAAQADGKVIAAGFSFDSAFRNTTVARFNVDGSLDTGFGSGGSVSTSVSDLKGFLADSFANEVIVQPDGKILVSADTYVQGKFVTIRYNGDGTPDNSFGNGGVSTISLSPEGGHAWDMALLPDGKIVIVGASGISAVEYLMIKLNADGTLDTSFGVDGKVLMSLNGRVNVISAVSIQTVVTKPTPQDPPILPQQNRR